MTIVIEDRAALDALDKGTEMRDVQGYYILKNRHGDYVVINEENGERLVCSPCEITGEYNGGHSRFLPLVVIGHCWFCDRETSRPMYGEAGQDWSCSEIHDDPR